MRLDEINPMAAALLLSIIYFIVFVVLEYSLFQRYNFTRPLLGAIIFFGVYLLFRRYLNIRIEKKIKK